MVSQKSTVERCMCFWCVEVTRVYSYLNVSVCYTLSHSNSTLRDIFNRNVYICDPNDKYKNIHRSITCNSSQLEITQMVISSSMDKYIEEDMHDFRGSNASGGYHRLSLGALWRLTNFSSCLVFAPYSSSSIKLRVIF